MKIQAGQNLIPARTLQQQPPAPPLPPDPPEPKESFLPGPVAGLAGAALGGTLGVYAGTASGALAGASAVVIGARR